jgi:hypothetical protein
VDVRKKLERAMAVWKEGLKDWGACEMVEVE